MTTFLPFYLLTRGLAGLDGHAAKGMAVSAFLLANALGGPLGGHLCDRLGRRPVMIWSFLLSVPPLFLAFQLPGYWGLAALSLGGCILALPHPANVIMAQEMMPQSAAIAGSMITGLAWGVAMLMTLPLGVVADRFSVALVLHERRVRVPLLDWWQLRNRGFAAAVGVNGVLHMTMMAAMFLGPLYVVRGLGLDTTAGGMLLVVIQVSVVATAFLGGWWYDRTHSRWLRPGAPAVVALGLAAWALSGPCATAARSSSRANASSAWASSPRASRTISTTCSWSSARPPRS